MKQNGRCRDYACLTILPLYFDAFFVSKLNSNTIGVQSESKFATDDLRKCEKCSSLYGNKKYMF